MLSCLAAFDRVARSGRLGEPVFFRCHVMGPPERALARLAETLAAVATVMGGVPDRLQAGGDAASGNLHAVLVFQSGVCALVYTGPGEDAVDAMLLGNHGAAYGPQTPVSRNQSGPSCLAGGTLDAVDEFREWIVRSLSRGPDVPP
jgi:hypothetical protein